MLNRFLIRIKLIATVLLIVGMVSAAVAYAMRKSNGTRLKPTNGFTLVTKETTIPFVNQELGTLKISYTLTTRYQKSDGTWKQVRSFYNTDGKRVKDDIAFAIPGEGVYQVDQNGGTLNFISPIGPKEQTSFVEITDEHQHPNFLREDVVQGYATNVLRFFDEADGGYVDVYRAPELNNRTIRKITVSPRGISVLEPLQITLSDPDDKVFEHLPRWPVRYERFEDKIRAMDESGKPDLAAGMRRQLERQLEKPGRDK